MDAAPRRRGALVDLEPITASAPFARLLAGRSIAGIGSQLTIVAVGLNVYALTGSTFAVSLTGVVALVPMILAGLYGGMLADAFDRRVVALVSGLLSWASTVAIAVLSWAGAETAPSLYVLTAVNAVATTVLLATESAITPRLLPARLLPAAAALGGISTGIAVTLGPALAGVLVAAVGYSWCYTVDAVLFVAVLLGVLTLPALPPAEHVDRPGLESLLGGMRFLRAAPNIRASFLVDIVAMTFGQPRVLFPAAGAVLLGGGAVTVGVLSAAYAVGALLSSVFSGRLGAVRRQGRAIELAIQAYGACILLFGAVLGVTGLGIASGVAPPPPAVDLPAIALATLLLAGAGAADNVSAIFRSTVLQAAAPDDMRGRLQGVFIVVVTGGPRIGDLYVGVVASLGLLWLPPVVGGALVIVIVAVLVRRLGFLAYDAADPRP
ncbi:MFS transporter [Amnibacterium sp. CER49]|uniref:MFS transporter n=1 Tax=Amnibacterium sp. CER49 TaxID=3039161 RepID=UPI00244D02FA|nr:MFS transporter [Amnibacterium sp. CER49]MDH2445039.1 MFS transporter [Amnibacterium sp. CER49]